MNEHVYFAPTLESSAQADRSSHREGAFLNPQVSRDGGKETK
jgi:hypothetical protein